MRSLNLFAATSLLAASVPAQTSTSFVVPAANATKEGNTLDLRPFGYDRCRVTHYMGSGILAGRLKFNDKITAIAYRRDGQAFPTLSLKRSTTPIWTIRMGNFWPSTTTQIERFLKPGTGQLNTLRTVFLAKKVSFPALKNPATGLPGFTIKFPLDFPFVFTGPDLAVDHYVYETRNRTHGYWVDAERSQVDHGDTKSYGLACPSGKNRAYAISSNAGSSAPMSLLLYEGPSLSPVIGILGASNKKWGPIALPFSLTPLGLKGCSLLASYDLTFPAQTRSEGSAQLDLPLPGLRSLANQSLYFQWLAIDKRVNPAFPIAMSNGVQIRIGKDLGKTGLDSMMIYRLSSNANSSVAHVDRGISLVTQITKM